MAWGRAALMIALTIFVSVLAMVLNVPSSVPYSPMNRLSNGYSSLITAYGLRSTLTLRGVGCGETVLVPLTHEMSASDVASLASLLTCGSTVVVLDDSSYSLKLLTTLGIDAYVDNSSPVLDEVMKYGMRWYPLVVVDVSNMSFQVAVKEPHPIVYSGKADIIGETSPYSYADTSGDGYYNVGERRGPFSVILGWGVGNGTLILISSPSIFTNELIGAADNAEFLEWLGGGVVYVGGLSIDPLEYARLSLLTFIAGLSDRVVSVIVFLLVLTVTALAVKGGGRPGRAPALTASVASFLIGVVASITSENPLPIIMSSAPALTLLSPRLARWVGPAFLASLAAASVWHSSPLVLPVVAASLLPLLSVSNEPVRVEGGFLGPSGRTAVLMGISASLAAFLSERALAVAASASVFSLLLSIAEWRGLRHASAELAEWTRLAYLGEEWDAIIDVEGRPGTRFCAYAEGAPTTCISLSGRTGRLRVGGRVKYIGKQRVAVEVVALGPRGLAMRSLGAYVVPFTSIPRFLVTAREAIRRYGLGREGVRLIKNVAAEVVALAAERGVILESATEAMLAERGFRAGEERRGRHAPGPGVRGFAEALFRVMEEILSGIKARHGTYKGVRFFSPGDSLRMIHWKKTLTHRRLVVKEYEEAYEAELRSSSAPAARPSPVLIADIGASSVTELDRVVVKLLETLTRLAQKDVGLTTYLVLTTPSKAMVLSGPVAGILAALSEALNRVMPELRFGYDPVIRNYPVEAARRLEFFSGRGPLAVIKHVMKRWAARVVRELIRAGAYPARPVVLFWPRVAELRSYFLIRALEASGYVIASPAELVGGE